MKRIDITPRNDWIRKVRDAGCANPVYEADNGTTQQDWREDVAYVFSSLEIQRLQDATEAVNKALMAAVDTALDNPHVMATMGIPEQTHQLMQRAWKQGHRNLAMRLDWSFDGTTPKLLEVNADALHGYVLGGPAQLDWLGDVYPHKNQWNDMGDRLKDAFRNLGVHRLGIAALEDDQALRNEAEYLTRMAKAAGLDASYLHLEQVGYHRQENVYTDVDDSVLDGVLTMSPMEVIIDTPFAEPWFTAKPPKTRFFEPAWVLLLNSKALLAWLWNTHSHMENLLPTYLAHEELADTLADHVRKPYWGEDGANVEVVVDGQTIAVQMDPLAVAPADDEWVVQQYCPLPDFGGHRPMVSTWVIGGKPAGLFVREGGLITDYFSPVVPHVVT